MKKNIIRGIEVHTQDIEFNEDLDELVLLGIASIYLDVLTKAYDFSFVC